MPSGRLPLRLPVATAPSRLHAQRLLLLRLRLRLPRVRQHRPLLRPLLAQPLQLLLPLPPALPPRLLQLLPSQRPPPR